MPEAVLAANFRPVRNSVVLAASYARPPAAARMVVDLLASSAAYSTLDARRMLDRLLAAKGPKAGASLGPVLRRSIRDARRARWRHVLRAGVVPDRVAARWPQLPAPARIIDRDGAALVAVAVLERPIDRPAAGVRLVAGRRPIDHGAEHLTSTVWGVRSTDHGAVADVRAPAWERVQGERDAGVTPGPWRLDRDLGIRTAGVRVAGRTLTLDPATPAMVVTQAPLLLHDPEKPFRLVVGWTIDADPVRGAGHVWWPRTLAVHDPGKVALVDWGMAQLSYPVHEALVVHRWSPAARDLSLRPVVARAPVPTAVFNAPVDARTGLVVWFVGAGQRFPTEHAATRFDLFVPGRRIPTEHPAAPFPVVPPGRRFPTEHGAVRLHVPPPGARKQRSVASAVLPGAVPLPIPDRPAVLTVPRWRLLVRRDVRDGLLVARMVPVVWAGKLAWVFVPVHPVADREAPRPAIEVAAPDVLVVRDVAAQAAVYGLEVATRLPDQGAVAWPGPAGADRGALEAVRLRDQRLDWGQYAPYFPWPEDNTRPYDPPQEPWPDTEPVDDPQNPPPNPVADPITGEPTCPAPGEDPDTGDPAVLPPRDPVQVPDERDEDFDVDVEEGILLNFIARFWDIWQAYRVYYAHVTASVAVNHLFAMLAAWLNDNAYDARYWAIYWTIRDCGRAAVMEFCPTYLRREWRGYHEDHQDLDRDPPPVGEWRDDPVNPWRVISGIDADGQFWAVLRSAPGLDPGEESWVELEVETFHDDAVVMFDRAVSGAGAGGLESREVVRYAEDFEDGTAGSFTVSGAGWSVVVTPTGNALKSDNTVAGDVAGAHLVVSLTRTGYVVFDYEVAANRLRVYVDDAVALDTGATDGWVAAHRIDLGPGVHTITWEVTDVGAADPNGRRFAQIDDIRVVEREPVDGPPVVDSYLEFYVNGVRRATWHGETPWNPPGAPATFHLGKGRHLLLWRFVRGPSNPGEDEKGMIDDIRITHVALARAWTETICRPDSGNAAIQRVWECLLALWNDRHRLKRLRRRWLVT